ncbi:unnamed protein product [Ilex paraguariensis]|uniref:Phytocyanin domain-containing protein n=1 Tax=Ilex paraguariensis TaxID=185542 RepID=A0ABC8T337_9AQUA
MKNSNMASFLGHFCAVLLLIMVMATINTPVGASKEFEVGNGVGWRQPRVNETELYNHWAARRRFHVGDSLRFEYKNDSVLVVDKWGYYHCNTSNPISVFSDGNTVINLDRPGSIYFISGDPDHCNNGQRLVVEVITLHPISHTPHSIASPPQPYSAMSPGPSTHSSSGESVSVTMVSALMAHIATYVTLLLLSP